MSPVRVAVLVIHVIHEGGGRRVLGQSTLAVRSCALIAREFALVRSLE